MLHSDSTMVTIKKSLMTVLTLEQSSIMIKYDWMFCKTILHYLANPKNII